MSRRDENTITITSSPPLTRSSPSTRVIKEERVEASYPLSETRVKEEAWDAIIDLSTPPRNTVKTRTLVENDVEIHEILSSDEEMDVVEEILQPRRMLNGGEKHAVTPVPRAEPDSDDILGPGSDDITVVASDADDSDDEDVLHISTTDWQDPHIVSEAINQSTKITRETKVERVEYLTAIPSYWPVPRIPTAYVLDLRDSKFDFVDENGVALTADALIKNKVCVS